MKNIIEITEENYQKWEEILQIGYDVEDGMEEKEVFENAISNAELKWAGLEKMIKIIEEALNDYDDEMQREEEEEEEEEKEEFEDSWEFYYRESEAVINNYGYGWD